MKVAVVHSYPPTYPHAIPTLYPFLRTALMDNTDERTSFTAVISEDLWTSVRNLKSIPLR